VINGTGFRTLLRTNNVDIVNPCGSMICGDFFDGSDEFVDEFDIHLMHRD